MLTRLPRIAERKAGLVAGVPLQRMGKPEEIAQLIVFLASTEHISAPVRLSRRTAAKRRDRVLGSAKKRKKISGGK